MGKQSLPTREMADASSDFDGLYEANQPLIYRFMFWRTKDRMLAEDLTSSVFEKAWRTRTAFTGGSGRAWLFRIARTTLIDHWRKAKDITGGESLIDQAQSSAPPLEDTLDAQLQVADLRAAVARLPRDMRRVVELRFIGGLSARQAGEQLGLSEANVRVIQYRALRKLKEYLQ